MTDRQRHGDPLTKAQSGAAGWLLRRSGDGVFDKNGVLLAGGERAPYMRATWNWLRDEGLVVFYKNGGKATRCCLAGLVPRNAILDSSCLPRDRWRVKSAQEVLQDVADYGKWLDENNDRLTREEMEAAINYQRALGRT